MLDFEQNLNRIEHLTHDIITDIIVENFHSAKEHLDEIHVYANAARILLEQFRTAKARSDPFDTDLDT